MRFPKDRLSHYKTLVLTSNNSLHYFSPESIWEVLLGTWFKCSPLFSSMQAMSLQTSVQCPCTSAKWPIHICSKGGWIERRGGIALFQSHSSLSLKQVQFVAVAHSYMTDQAMLPRMPCNGNMRSDVTWSGLCSRGQLSQWSPTPSLSVSLWSTL